MAKQIKTTTTGFITLKKDMRRFLVFVICIGTGFAADIVSVNTKLGVINGKSVKVPFRGKEFVSKQFLGIPFAKPPVGSLRFKRPEPHEALKAPFDAMDFGTACPQVDTMNFGTDSKNEDCLTLNVYVPMTPPPSSTGYAVMVFIHGGGFTLGASSMIPSEVLSCYGNVILVSMNYRLGLFGFANTGDDRAQGNMGLWDQKLAIRWVNENIEAFGGDSSKITIFGESAGSMSVYMQGMYPKNKGLFQNIIGESGTPTMPFGAATDNKGSLTFVAEKLGCSTDDFDAAFACLQNADINLIMSQLGEILQNPETLMALQFLPTIDGEFLKRDPGETIIMAKDRALEEIDFFRSLRVINGVNSAEGAMWLPIFLQNVDLETAIITHDDMKNTHIGSMLPLFTKGQPVPDLLKSLVAFEYTDWSSPDNAREMFVKFMGDVFFAVPGLELSLLHANASTSMTWMYYFDAILEKNLLPSPSWVPGANHGDELMPVFGYCITGYGELANLTDYVPPEWELDLSEKMMTMWSNFAKYGNPNGNDSQEWPQFEFDSQKHLAIRKELSVGQYLYNKEWNFWRELVPLTVTSLEGAHSADSPFSKTSPETCDASGNCD